MKVTSMKVIVPSKDLNPTSGKIEHLELVCRDDKGGELKIDMPIAVNVSIHTQWLCGTTIIHNFQISGLQTKRVPQSLVLPKEVFTTQFDNFTNLYNIKLQSEYIQMYNDAVYAAGDALIKAYWKWFITMSNVQVGNALLLGGRITPHNSTDRTIRSPELADYIRRNQIGVISATHGHLNKNYTNNLVEGGMSVYQYWLWTYQHEESPFPQVMLTNPEMCGVFTGKYEREALEELFEEYWSKRNKQSRAYMDPVTGNYVNDSRTEVTVKAMTPRTLKRGQS